MKVWVLTGDKMETAAATCYASKLFRRSTQILELTTKRTEEQSLHDVLHDLSRTVLRHHGSMTRDTLSGWVHTHTHTHTHTTHHNTHTHTHTHTLHTDCTETLPWAGSVGAKQSGICPSCKARRPPSPFP